MENQANSKGIILNNGLYLGLTGVIIGLILYAMGKSLELQWVSSLVGFIATVIFVVIGLKAFKASNNGFMSWSQGLKIGMGIVMISAVITIIYTLLFTTVIEPDFQQQAMEFQQQKWLDAGMTQEQIEAFTESSEKFQSPVIISAMILAISAFIGFVVSAIVAAIMKKSEEETY
jgi:amino acid transporter